MASYRRTNDDSGREVEPSTAGASGGGDHGKGIHAIWALPEGNGVGVCCECRTRTEIIIDMDGVFDIAHIDLPEQSFTCDGCGTTHWFVLSANHVTEG